MSQRAFPASFVGGEWTGSASHLKDSSDGTYIISPVNPDPAKPFLVILDPIADPGVDTGHILRLRATIDTIGAGALILVLALENSDDDSVVAWLTKTDVPDTGFIEIIFELDPADVANIHDYGRLQVRGYWYQG